MAKRNRRAKRKCRRKFAAKPTPEHHVIIRLPRVTIDPGRQWYVVKTLHRETERTVEAVEQHGVVPYVPAVIERVMQRGRLRDVKRLPLGGYWFAGFPVAAHALEFISEYNYAEFRKTYVRPIVGVYGPVYHDEVQDFADRMARDDEPMPDVQTFERGDMVRVEDGPFYAFNAVVSEVRGGIVLADVNMFGRMVPVEFEMGQLQPL